MKFSEFKKILNDDLADLSEEHGYNLKTTAERGQAFQLWYANLIFESEGGFDEEPIEASFTSKDLNIDICFTDRLSKKVVLAQCKFYSLSNNKLQDKDELSSFFTKHNDLLNDEYIRKHGSELTYDALQPYKSWFEGGWSIEYRFVTTAKSNQGLQDYVDHLQNNLHLENITFDLVGRDDLVNYYSESSSLEQGINETVNIHFRDGIIHNPKPYEYVLGVVSANELRNVYKKYRQKLYAFNIRSYLGSNAINKDMIATAEREGGKFFYFNNGITAICTNIKLDKSHLSADNFQIINGAQTVTSLAKARDRFTGKDGDDLTSIRDALILMRVVVTGSKKSLVSGFNEKIIRYNNTQNKIELADFRSNDPIQIWLEKNLTNPHSNWAISRFYYQRKRGRAKPQGKRSVGKKLSLVYLSKILYAFSKDFQPVVVYDNSKDLIRPNDESGIYNDLFGDRDQAVWSNERLDEAMFAVGLFYRQANEFKLFSKDPDETMPSIHRTTLKWWYLALGAEYYRYKKFSAHTLIKSKKNFEDYFNGYFRLAKSIIDSHYNMALSSHNILFKNFKRQKESWKSAKDQFVVLLDIRH